MNPQGQLIILAGTPAITLYGGNVLLTTLLAPTTEFFPIVTFDKITAPSPIQTLSSMMDQRHIRAMTSYRVVPAELPILYWSSQGFSVQFGPLRFPSHRLSHYAETGRRYRGLRQGTRQA